jgi:hypothetical protein
MDMPKPGPGHSKLERLAGTWEGEEKMFPSEWDPKGGAAKGTTKSRLALDGFAVIGDYRQERNGATTYSGHSVFTFDEKSNAYSVHWFDCLGSPPEVFTGQLKGDVLVMAHGGPGMHARLTYDLRDANLLQTKMEMSKDGSAWNTLFEGRYKRI